MDAHHRVTEVRRSTTSDPLSADGADVVLTWSGDLVVRAAALPALLGPSFPPAVRDDTLSLGVLAAKLHLSAHDVFDVGARAASAMRTYWHEPDTVDAYYIGQMQLCVARSPLDLYDPTWPLPTAATGFAPAKVVTCNAGRAGQAVDSLVSDGSVIRGGVVIKSVVGPGVLVDSGAEVEDCVLLDGCRIGRGARVRRAVIGAGVSIGDAEEIGYAARPPAPAEVLRSGLTLVPPTSGGAAAAVGAR
jgi:glucose-1-phosphate adenylyltransferase